MRPRNKETTGTGGAVAAKPKGKTETTYERERRESKQRAIMSGDSDYARTMREAKDAFEAEVAKTKGKARAGRPPKVVPPGDGDDDLDGPGD